MRQSSFEEKMLAQMETGEVSALKEWLHSIVLEDSSFSRRAEELLERLDAQFPNPEPVLSALKNMPPLPLTNLLRLYSKSEACISTYRMLLTGAGIIPFMIPACRIWTGGQIGDPSMKLATRSL